MVTLLLLAQVVAADGANASARASYTFVARSNVDLSVEATRSSRLTDSTLARARLSVEISGSGNERVAVVTVDSLALRNPVIPIGLPMFAQFPSGDTTFTERFEMCRVALPTGRAPTRLCPPTTNLHLSLMEPALALLFPGLDGQVEVRPGMPPRQGPDTVAKMEGALTTIQQHHWASVGPHAVQDSIIGTIEFSPDNLAGGIQSTGREIRTFEFAIDGTLVRATGRKRDAMNIDRQGMRVSATVATVMTLERDSP